MPIRINVKGDKMLLVTGITGHTGNFFLKELIKQDYQKPIRFIVRETSDTTILYNCGLNIEIVYGDLNDLDFLTRSMQGIEAVLHIAGIQKSLNVIRAATLNMVQQVILVHTTGIFSKYKSASEEYLKIEDEIKKIIEYEYPTIKLTILRPTMIYGDICDLNMSKFIRMVDYFRLFPIINNGENFIQPVNARDLGRAYFQVITTPAIKLKYEYIVSGDAPITMKNALKEISKALGKKITFISFPLWFGVALGKLLYYITNKKVDYIEKIQRMGEDRSFPHHDATKDFGFSPSSFQEGINREVLQYQNAKRGCIR